MTSVLLQPHDWLLGFYLVLTAFAIWTKLRAVRLHRHDWPLNWLRIMAVGALLWVGYLTARAILDIPRMPHPDTVIAQVVPVVLLVALEAAHGWIEW